MKNFTTIFTLLTAATLWSMPSWSATPPSKKKVAAPTARVAKRVVGKIAAPLNAQAAALSAAAMSRAPASVPRGGNTQDISEELKIMGQSRNLSMGLLFQKDKDKLTFGTPRTNYQDKISDKKANF